VIATSPESDQEPISATVPDRSKISTERTENGRAKALSPSRASPSRQATASARRNGAKNIASPLKWFGGKHYLAQRIIALMPPHTHYVEPYFGSGAVLLARDPEDVSEVINDLHGDLMTFWRVLQNPDDFERFRRAVDAVPFSETEWQEARDGLENAAETDAVRRAVWFFIFCRQSRAGQMDDFATLSRNRTRRQMNEQASAWLTTFAGLPAVHERLKRVVILNRPALEVIRSQDGPNTLFYCDPPYLHETRTATKVYDFEMTEEEHRELLDVLQSVEGKVMLSGYPSELYDKTLAEWTRHSFELPNNAAGGATKGRETEVLWCNW
jgi:DNA adenine methylase